MTFYCIQRIADKYFVDIEKETITVEDHIMSVTGTSAELGGG